MFKKLFEWLGLVESGKTLVNLSNLLEFGPNKEHVERLSKFPIKYTTFKIPKKTSGVRIIEAPSDELKQIQRKIITKILDKIPPHSATMAYRQGRSIVNNALPHLGKTVGIKMDLENFFGSTSSEKIMKFFQRIGWSRKASSCLTRLCTYQDHIPQVDHSGNCQPEL